MQEKNPIDVMALFEKMYRGQEETYLMPPPIIETMQCEIIAFDAKEKTLTAKMPVLLAWCNPFSTMQGGMIMAAVDNAVGPLSMLIATPSWTRNMTSKYLKPVRLEVEYIYVTAVVRDERRGRLVFDVQVTDAEGIVYAEAEVTNWLMQKKNESMGQN